jgi:hypothetical protein
MYSTINQIMNRLSFLITVLITGKVEIAGKFSQTNYTNNDRMQIECCTE